MRLSILVAALSSRADMSAALFAELDRQLIPGEVELVVYEDDGKVPSGRKRNWLMDNSNGLYFAFVDDDDLVADDYVEQILRATQYGPDVVTFDVKYSTPNKTEIMSFGLRHSDGVRAGPSLRLMTANHLCAWRRECGTRVRFPNELGYNDDCFWYKPLVKSGIPTIEEHVHSVLYFYNYNPSVTRNQRDDVVRASKAWADGGIEFYIVDGEIMSAVNGVNANKGKATVIVQDRYGSLRTIDRCFHEPFTTVEVC